VGGLENGIVNFWSSSALLNGEDPEKALIHQSEKYSGSARGLEFNPFQENLLASGIFLFLFLFLFLFSMFWELELIRSYLGGGEGEIFIWDLNNLAKVLFFFFFDFLLFNLKLLTLRKKSSFFLSLSQSLTPLGPKVKSFLISLVLHGTKKSLTFLPPPHPMVQISFLKAFFQFILNESLWKSFFNTFYYLLQSLLSFLSFSLGATVIWDLKNKKEAMTLTNPNNKQVVTSIAWNPDLPTQIITASEDDNQPSLLVWDVRNARFSSSSFGRRVLSFLNENSFPYQFLICL